MSRKNSNQNKESFPQSPLPTHLHLNNLTNQPQTPDVSSLRLRIEELEDKVNQLEGKIKNKRKRIRRKSSEVEKKYIVTL